jgi:NDP-sugar pyrophosphorylase family protein
MKALVLAAGHGTRIRDVAGDLPKPLLPVQGRPVLDYTLRWLAASGVADVWINLHYHGERIRQHVGTGERFGLRVRYSEEDPVLGTAGALGKLRREWTETFLVVYGDNLVRFTLTRLLDGHRALGSVATIALFDPRHHPNTGIAGGHVLLGDDGRVRRFVEGPARDPGALVNAGVYALEPAVARFIPDDAFCDFGRDVFPRLLADGVAVGGHVIDGYCLGLDAPEPLARGLELVRRGAVELA